MSTQSYRCWVEVSRSAIRSNYRRVRQVVGDGVEVLGVVKADAYGHGATEVSRLLESEGARWLAVSNAAEGVALRHAGINARILVMADCLPQEYGVLAEYELTPVVHSLHGLAALNSFAASRGARMRYHLKLDTGMGRLGASGAATEIVESIRQCRQVEFEGLMTHFASSADYTSGQTERQIEAFGRVLSELERAGLEPRWKHLSSTNPIAYGRKPAWGNMVRAGHALYGYISPAKGEAPPRVLDVSPALAWKATILAVKRLPVGAQVGYGGTFRTERPTTIAVLAAGYADGIPHRMSNRGKVIAAGNLVPVIGAVSMDLTTIDITDVSGLCEGDSVTLLGQEGDASLNAQQIARWAGTISYVVLCGISSRVPRVYV